MGVPSSLLNNGLGRMADPEKFIQRIRCRTWTGHLLGDFRREQSVSMIIISFVLLLLFTVLFQALSR
jgi:hypothetical protein